MAEEFYTASVGICGGNWWSSPRNAMFPGIGTWSPCLVDVSNFYCPADSVKSRRICDDYSGGDKPGFSACDYDFPVTNAGNGFSPSVISGPNKALFGDDEKVAEINTNPSILSEFSGKESSAFVQSFLFEASDLYNSRGIPENNLNDRNQPVFAEDHFSNLDRISAPSLPKLRSNSKPNKTQLSNKTATMESKAINERASTVDSPAQQRLGTKLISDVGGNKRDANNYSTKRSTNMVESGLKRQRIQTPSPLPIFKVRKEKLGDRITALQQLVSPFGKTDTASVLHEAIDYIKFLHDQVHVLSDPYMKKGPRQDNDGKFPARELRSRGLCLVPILSTFPIASETPVDFWTPTMTLGGNNFK